MLLDQFPLCKKSVNLANLGNFLLCEYFRRHLLHEMGLILHLFSGTNQEEERWIFKLILLSKKYFKTLIQVEFPILKKRKDGLSN